MAMVIRGVLPYLLTDHNHTSNQATIQAVKQPKQQSGQASVIQIYDTARELRKGYNQRQIHHHQYGKSKETKRQDVLEGVGKHLKKIDTAQPERHTRTLYDALERREASVVAQLRTGIARFNGYLHSISIVEFDQCAYGQARETNS